MSALMRITDSSRTSREVRKVPTRDIARLPRERAPRKRGAPGANSQALIGSTRFTPWRVTEARRESRETHAPWACDADLPGFKFLIRRRCAQYCLRDRERVGNSVMALRSV